MNNDYMLNQEFTADVMEALNENMGVLGNVVGNPGNSLPIVMDEMHELGDLVIQAENSKKMRCKYGDGKCDNERARKRSGKILTLCEFHRQRACQNQMKLDSKKRKRKQSSNDNKEHDTSKVKKSKTVQPVPDLLQPMLYPYQAEDHQTLQQQVESTSLDSAFLFSLMDEPKSEVQLDKSVLDILLPSMEQYQSIKDQAMENQYPASPPMDNQDIEMQDIKMQDEEVQDIKTKDEEVQDEENQEIESQDEEIQEIEIQDEEMQDEEDEEIEDLGNFYTQSHPIEIQPINNQDMENEYILDMDHQDMYYQDIDYQDIKYQSWENQDMENQDIEFQTVLETTNETGKPFILSNPVDQCSHYSAQTLISL